MTTTTLALGLAQQSAASAFTAKTAAVSGAVGLVALLLGWGLHHEFAHVHRIADLGAKALLIAGGVILFAGTGLATTLNKWTVPVMRWLASLAHLSGPWPATFGLLTAIELLLVPLFIADVIYTIRVKTGRAGGESNSTAGRLFRKQWMRVKFYYEKYGVIAVGPLSPTLPGMLGYVFALPFAALAGAIGHLLGLGTGW